MPKRQTLAKLANIKAGKPCWHGLLTSKPEAHRRYAISYQAAHPELAVRYKASKRAIPWADKFILAEAYDLAKRRSVATGIMWSVDHIIPLRHPRITGLHTHNNIQVIPQRINEVKGNRSVKEYKWSEFFLCSNLEHQ